MIDKKCSIITDDDGFLGIVKVIDEDFIHIEMDTVMIAVPKLRIKSIVYSLQGDIKIPKKKQKRVKRIEEVPQKEKIKPKDISTKALETSPFLSSIKRKLGESNFDLNSKIGDLNISVVPLADDTIDFSTLKKQNINDFIQNPKLK